ncbi:MAG: nitroreductase family protein [bacterium]
MSFDAKNHENRKTEYEIGGFFLERWSPRAFADEKLPESELFAMFEAARFAPSSSNEQPWRFVYALRGSGVFDSFGEILSEGNWRWARNAAALLVVCSRETFARNDKPNSTHLFDTGCAWGYFALEAIRRGWVTHAMAGFNREKAKELLEIPDGFFPVAAVAIGRHGDPASLPEDLRDREVPAPRRRQSEFVFEGKFGNPPE